MEGVIEITAYLGALLRVFGLLVFGFAAGWFSLYAFKQPERRWELQVATFLGFFLFVAYLTHYTSPGGIGAFGLGAGAALLLWGLRKEKGFQEEEEEGDS
ncbi:MAG: hypothetical protein AB1345_12140 [Chloroflexota bacterium]